ncbi:MAG: hypothetical protein O2909_08625 [Chloroflexi bacterium]|nr:hypothetical protein [Chloroflexota bacterium]MDA1219493.1 hypothetical protein [Chloroflexota bacterium]
MEQPQNDLIHWDKHRIPVNLTVIFSLAVAVFGLYSMFTGNEGNIRGEFIVVLGLASAAYSWLTNPRSYLIYPDALFVVYGRPRIKKILFENISHLEMRELVTPDRLRVWMIQGRRVVLMAKNPEEFHDKLQEALDDFRKRHPELVVVEPDSSPES